MLAFDGQDEIVFARPEYRALAEEFARLAEAFGHDIDPKLRRDIARLATAIERIDRGVDDSPTDDERRARWGVVVRGLRRGTLVNAGDELGAAVQDLHRLADERGVLDRVRRIVAKEVVTSEGMRTERRRRSFLRLVEREGRLTAALALVIAGSACGVAFRRFFFRMAAPANIVDKIVDAREDHVRGEIVLRPGIALYACLFTALVARGLALFTSCPRPVFLVRLGLRYLLPSRPSTSTRGEAS